MAATSETPESAAPQKPVFKTTGSKRPATNLSANFGAEEYVFREGDLGTEMFIMHEGRVEITQGDPG